MSLPAILVGGGASALSAARSLGRAGVESIALGDPRSPVRRSRYRRTFVAVPEGPELQSRWLAALRGLDPGVVLPCTDEALELVARQRDELSVPGHVVYDCADAVALAMLDKEQTYALARGIGIRTPRTRLASGSKTLEEAADEIGFPCALKPVAPVEFRRVYGLDRKLFVAHELRELAAAYRETAAHGLEMLVTEIVPGPDDAVWTYTACVAAGGRPVLEGTKRKLRQWPPHFGIGSYHATGADQQVLDAGRRFVRGVGARGLAAVEFKRDARTGDLVLIECNQRFPNGCEVFAAAGLNFPLAVYEQTIGRTPRPQQEPRQDARLLFFVEDLRSFLELRRAGELTTAAWLRSLAHRQRFPVFSVGDPVPSLVTNAALVAGVARRRIRRLGHGRAPA